MNKWCGKKISLFENQKILRHGTLTDQNFEIINDCGIFMTKRDFQGYTKRYTVY